MGQRWIVDFSAFNHITWDKEYFNPDSYQTYDIEQNIQGAGGTFSAIGTGNVKITV